MNEAILSLGSNIRPELYIEKAKQLLGQKFDWRGESQFVVTKPIGFKDQADFLNGAILIKTPFEMDQVQAILKKIEAECGRIRTENKFGPRTIDIDVVVWNDQVIDENVFKRDFLKSSIQELKPELKV